MSSIGARPLHCVKGKAALVRRLRGLLVAVARFGRARARTHEDVLWCALLAAVETADTRPQS
jgi:hypothetical protein